MQEAESGATDAPGADDVQAPKQARATNAEELAGLLKQSLALGIDIKDAYVRPDIEAPIDILFGNQKMGVRHIIDRRTQDGTLSILTTDELLSAIAQCIAGGRIRHITNRQRIELTLGDSGVILVSNPEKNAWVLTGWAISNEQLERLKALPSDERRPALLNSSPTLASSTFRRASEGADGIGIWYHPDRWGGARLSDLLTEGFVG